MYRGNFSVFFLLRLQLFEACTSLESVWAIAIRALVIVLNLAFSFIMFLYAPSTITSLSHLINFVPTSECTKVNKGGRGVVSLTLLILLFHLCKLFVIAVLFTLDMVKKFGKVWAKASGRLFAY